MNIPVAIVSTLLGVVVANVAVMSATNAADVPRNSLRVTEVQRQDTSIRLATNPVYPGVTTLREELSIGQVNGPEEYMLANLADAHFGSDGSVFIADYGGAGGRTGPLSTIRRYDTTGKFVRSYGRGGQGPGEFRGFNGMYLLPDGRFLLNDVSARMVHVYAANGNSAADWLIPRETSNPGTTSFFVNPNGHMYLLMSTRPTATATVTRRFAMVVNPTGQITDTIHAPLPPDLPPNTLTATSPDGSVQRASVPFAPSFRSAFSTLGYWVTARSDRYAIDLNMPNGQVVSIRRNIPALPLSNEERNAFKASVENNLRRLQPGWNWNGPEIPRTKPYFLTLMTDYDGRIWARVFDQSEKLSPEMDMDDASINHWDVFEPSGRFLGRVQTPIGTLPSHARGDRMLGVARNADGVPRIIRYRIQWNRGQG